jgi:hypothetical protein
VKFNADELNNYKEELSYYSSRHLLELLATCELRHTVEITVIKYILIERGIDVQEIEKADQLHSEKYEKLDPFKVLFADKDAKTIVFLICFFVCVYVIETLIYIWNHP